MSKKIRQIIFGPKANVLAKFYQILRYVVSQPVWIL